MRNKQSTRLSETRMSFTLAAMVCAALGLFLLFAPNTSRKLLCMLVGAGVTAYGLLIVLPALRSKNARAYTLHLLLGVCAIAFGAFSLLNPTFLMDLLFTVLGMIVVVISANGIRRALRLRAFGFVRWQAPLTASAVTMALALSMILFPGLYGNWLMRLCGLLLLTDGACDLASLHLLGKYDNP